MSIPSLELKRDQFSRQRDEQIESFNTHIKTMGLRTTSPDQQTAITQLKTKWENIYHKYLMNVLQQSLDLDKLRYELIQFGKDMLLSLLKLRNAKADADQVKEYKYALEKLLGKNPGLTYADPEKKVISGFEIKSDCIIDKIDKEIRIVQQLTSSMSISAASQHAERQREEQKPQQSLRANAAAQAINAQHPTSAHSSINKQRVLHDPHNRRLGIAEAAEEARAQAAQVREQTAQRQQNKSPGSSQSS